METGPKKPKQVKEGEQWIQIRVSKEDHKRLKAWATKNSTSVSYLMRRLAQRALAKKEDEAGRLP